MSRPARSRRAPDPVPELLDEATRPPTHDPPVPSDRTATPPGPGRGRFDFIGSRHLGYLVSFLLMAVTFASLAASGLNWGMEYTGGSLYRFRLRDASRASAVRVREVLDSPGLRERLEVRRVQEIESPEARSTGGADFLVFATFEEGTEATDPLPEALSLLEGIGGATLLSRLSIGPTIGETLRSDAVFAVVLSWCALLVYVWARFDFRWGVVSILALVHDCLVVLGVFSLLQREVTSDTLAALLTIIGYSLNDTIVIMDRVRENLQDLRLRKALGDEGIFNLSINQSLSRTVNTAVTSLLPVLALLVLGGPDLQDLGLAFLVGIVSGAWSTVYIVSALLVDWARRDRTRTRPPGTPNGGGR